MPLPQQILGDLITPTIWNTQVNAINASTASLATTPLLRPSQTYTATLAQVLNTVSETLILSFDIPANNMADGDLIEIVMSNLEKNNKGTDGTITAKVNVGAGAQVTITSTASFQNGATEYTNERMIRLQRMGAAVVVLADGLGGFTSNLVSAPVNSYGSSTPANFTALQTVSLKVTLSAADATFYIKPQSASVFHRRN